MSIVNLRVVIIKHQENTGLLQEETIPIGNLRVDTVKLQEKQEEIILHLVDDMIIGKLQVVIMELLVNLEELMDKMRFMEALEKVLQLMEVLDMEDRLVLIKMELIK